MNPRNRRSVLLGASFAGMVAGALTLAGCALLGGGDGALATDEDGGRPTASYMTLGVLPDQAMVFDLYVVNHSSHPVRVTAARLLPLEGYALPRLEAKALVHGNIAAGLTRGWPPPQVHGLSRLAGSMLGPGTTDLAVAVSGATAGTNYGTVGVELTYDDGGEAHQVSVYGGAVACVRTVIESCPGRVQHDDQRVMDYIHAQ